MADLIDRQAAIDALAEHEKSKGHNYTMFVDVVSECAEIIRDLPSAQPEQQWIPVSERLPEERQWVLCNCLAGIMDVLRLTNDGCWNKNYPHAEYMSGFVIAWMPLPVPYKEEQDV